MSSRQKSSHDYDKSRRKNSRSRSRGRDYEKQRDRSERYDKKGIHNFIKFQINEEEDGQTPLPCQDFPAPLVVPIMINKIQTIPITTQQNLLLPMEWDFMLIRIFYSL